MSGTSRERRTWDLGVISQVSRAGPRKRQVVAFTACFLGEGVSLALPCRAGLGLLEERGQWARRGGREGARVTGELAFEVRRPVHVCQLREKPAEEVTEVARGKRNA